MNIDHLKRMSAQELNEYAELLGFSVTSIKGVNAKIEEIQKRRNRHATITVLGVDLDIPLRALRDKRFNDILNTSYDNNEEVEKAMVMLLGEEQYGELVAAVTEDDGVVDIDALSFAIGKIVTNPQLKNF